MPYDAPPWPPHYQTGTVYGKFVGSDGLPIVGTIQFTPRALAAAAVNDATVVVAKTVSVPLDGSGAFTTPLPATDDPDVRPLKFTYSVVENWPNGRAYDIYVPMGTTQNILDISPIQPSTGIMRYIGPPGPPGTGGSTQSPIVMALVFGYRRF